MASTTVRRSRAAVRYARTASSIARLAECSTAGVAPTARVSASTPIRKLDCTAEALTSAASTSMGVRLLAASVIPVSAFVMPGPWCRLRIAGRPVLRAHASAMHAAPFSCRAATNRAPRATSAFVTMKFPLPTTPKMVSAPSSASAAATAS